MKTTEHGTIVRVLERQALQFRSDLRQVEEQGSVGPQIDETGTLEVIGVERAEVSRERELRARMLEKEELRGVMDKALEVHGPCRVRNRRE